MEEVFRRVEHWRYQKNYRGTLCHNESAVGVAVGLNREGRPRRGGMQNLQESTYTITGREEAAR